MLPSKNDPIGKMYPPYVQLWYVAYYYTYLGTQYVFTSVLHSFAMIDDGHVNNVNPKPLFCWTPEKRSHHLPIASIPCRLCLSSWGSRIEPPGLGEISAASNAVTPLHLKCYIDVYRYITNGYSILKYLNISQTTEFTKAK
jgi:hypothetical protein